MTAFKGINKEIYMEMIGSLPQLRKMAQSLQTSIDSMIPLAADDGVKVYLSDMSQAARNLDTKLGALYHDEAPEAFSEGR